ncbi:MAG: hypothetical protein PVI86_04030 [Phycisphaerae bacterium]|jgi:hypothetical protein
MALPPGRFSQLRWLQNLVSVCGLIGAIALMGLGVIGYGSSENAVNVWMVAAGAFALIVVVMLMTFAPLLLKIESTVARQLGELRDLQETANRQIASLEAIVENTRLSDAAKSLARREQELDALRNAIREEIRRQRWDSALSLSDEMETRFGYKEEADRIREELDDARNTAIDKKLGEAIEMIESHFQSHDWDRAQAEIDRILNALPDNVKALALIDRMKVLKEQHKRELRAAWAEAVRRNDTDQAIDILRELDQYLSPAEAQELQDSARNVFKEKLLQLGVQFRFAVTEKRWHDALSVGLELVREFPNARMAGEVREVLDTLRERARATAVAENAPPPEPSQPVA